MSIHISLVHPDRVELLTDGAVYDPKGVLKATREKVTAVPGLPAAMTTRGSVALGGRLEGLMLRIFEAAGTYDEAIAFLTDKMPEIEQNAFVQVEMLIAGLSENSGPVVHYFHTAPDLAEAPEPFVVHSSRRGFLGNMEIPVGHYQTAVAAGGLRSNAVQMMETQRRSRSATVTTQGLTADLHFIGGHIDHTLVSADGVRTSRVHTWADEIGQPIDPFKGSENVTPLNRRQRRAAARGGRRQSA